MTRDELARRQPVWDAMTELFLDTETRWSVPFVARRCAESGYDDEALERIFWAEVFPEAIPHMLKVSVLKLDEQALINRANHGHIPWLTRRAHGAMVQNSWLAVRQVTAWLRGMNAAELELHVRALEMLDRRYLEDPEHEWAVASPELAPIAREEWVRYEPVCRAMLGDEPDFEARAAAVTKFLQKP